MILWRIWREVKDMFKFKMMELSIGNFITGNIIINGNKIIINKNNTNKKKPAFSSTSLI